MFRLARAWRVQRGSVFRTSRQLQCGVNSELIDYALRATKEVLLRDRPAQVAGFNRVKVRPSSPLIDEVPLSQIVMHVDLADETPLLLRDLSPPFLKCVETVLEGGGLEAKGALSTAVANLKSGLNQLVNPEGQFGLSDCSLKALDSASEMLEADANVKIVAELLLPLMKGYCVFNMHHRKALQAHAIKNRMFLPPSLHWNGLAIGNSKLWFGELDMLLCPHLGILQEPGHFPIAVVQKSDGDFVPELSIAVEGKRRIKEDWSLLGGRTHFAQAYATAIVFSFLCHYKFNMKRSFIPSLWISPQAFAVFFYDCKEDIMISKACLWSEYTLVFLWSVLHYPFFYPSSWLDLGIESLPFGYLNNVRTDFKFIDEKEFHFGESLKSPAFRQTNPFLGRPICDLRDKPDKGIVFHLEPENNQDDKQDH